MPRHQVSATGLVKAAPARVYAILADYRDGHPHVLPRPPFGELVVEQGGTGAGTVIRFDMRVLGRTRRARGVVTEPAPGRVLAETYEDGTVTSFTVDPVGNQSRVRIETSWEASRGVSGLIERLITPRLFRKLYAQEFDLIERWAIK